MGTTQAVVGLCEVKSKPLTVMCGDDIKRSYKCSVHSLYSPFVCYWHSPLPAHSLVRDCDYSIAHPKGLVKRSLWHSPLPL